MFDVRLLETMLAVSEHGSFGGAAEHLHATQPGVSQQIARLERHLGVRLFERGNGPVKPTEAGRYIQALARDLLSAVARIESEARAWAEGRLGALALGVSSAIVTGDVAGHIREFRTASPQFRVSVEIASANVLAVQLDAGILDALITTLPSDQSADRIDVVVGSIPLALAVPSDHPLATRSSVSIRDVLDERLITVPRNQDADLHDRLISAWADGGRRVQIAAEEVAFSSVAGRVAMGEGVGLVPAGDLSHHSTGVAVVPLDGGFQLPVRFIARRGAVNAAAQALLDRLCAHDQPVVGHGGSPDAAHLLDPSTRT